MNHFFFSRGSHSGAGHRCLSVFVKHGDCRGRERNSEVKMGLNLVSRQVREDLLEEEMP